MIYPPEYMCPVLTFVTRLLRLQQLGQAIAQTIDPPVNIENPTEI